MRVPFPPGMKGVVLLIGFVLLAYTATAEEDGLQVEKLVSVACSATAQVAMGDYVGITHTGYIEDDGELKKIDSNTEG